MLSVPKTTIGAFTRKIIALVMAYSFFATSLWSLALPVEGLSVGRPVKWVDWSSPRKSIEAMARAATGNTYAASGATHGRFHPTIFTNFAELNAVSHADDNQAPTNCTVHSTQPSGDDGEDQDQRRDEHRSYQHHNYRYGSDDDSHGPPTPIVPTGVTIFGPQTYTRTTGATDDFTSTITVPAWDTQPFFLHVVNGDTSGNHRVSSAGIRINGVTIIGESVFNQKVASIDCAIQLTAQSTLQVDLDSKPGSFLTINVLGKSLDHTPPVVTIVSPASAINTPQPHLDIRYQDLVGAGETVASGVNTTTLQVMLDGVDRTSLFTRRADEATADLPPSLALAPGVHTITASIQDNAENLGQASEQFQVNTAAPVLQILQPAAGSYLNSTTPQIVLAYSSALGLNLASLKVTDNGADITAAFNKTATGASGTAPPLSQGGNTIVASISDQAGNQTTTSLVFNVDTTPPVINIVHPATGSNHGSSSVEYLVQYSDDQAIDPSTLVVTVDGSPLAVTPALTSVSGTVTLSDGASHVITASIKDKAGNPATTASSTFSVDTSLPNVHIIQPATSAILNNPTPPFQVTYSETASGVNTGTFKATVDGTDVTGLFIVGAASASATLQSPLADGSHTFFAQIASTVGNTGHDTNQVLIDTVKPQVTIVSPPGIVNTTTPGALVQYSDSGSGIDPTSVHITLDGVDVTGSFGVSSSSATGTLGAGSGLSEGPHQFAVTVADKAGNNAQPSVSFLVDVTPPVAAFSSPADGTFINNPQPTITLAYSDSVSGVDQSSIHIFLQQGTGAEAEITSLFTFSGGQATAIIPASSPLTPGTYHLRATVADKAGNQTPVNAAFVLDTVAPTYTIQTPAANAFLNTSTPTFTVVYQDDSSGVDTSKFALRVDGIDRTNRFTVTATGASGVLQPSDALPDGTHQVEVTVVDLAGNSAPIVPQSFLVDTVPPVISISAPLAASFTNNNHPSISVTYSDTGSGIDVTTLQVLIDGVDHTTEFTATATGATGSPAAALLDGSHTISASIKDLAGNQSSPGTTGFTIDTVRPVITATSAPAPNAAGWNTTDVTVSFVCSDNASGIVLCPPPQVVTTEGKAQVITGTVSDAAGNQATASVTLNIEKSAPTITASLNPAANAGGWNNSDVTVSFQCSPSASDVVSCQTPVTISTEGKNQQVSGTVTDQAGKTATASATVNLDKTPPLITANAAPPPNAAGWNNSDVIVTYTCSDALSGIVQCPSPATVSTEGAKQNIVAQATDQAGNTTPVSTVLSIDKTPPTITATAAPAPNGAGWNNSNVTVNFSCVDNLSGVASCSGQQTVASEGQSQNVSGQATDIAGNTATGSITVSIDKTPPTIVQISTPDHISQLHGGQVTVTVNDNFTVAQVVISVNGASLGTFTTPPYQVNLQVPAGANAGDTLTVSVVATDQAGNSQTASRGVSVAADGVIVGQVLSDTTGSPVQGASVQVISASGQTDTTDDRGRYSFQASDAHVFLSATNPGSTTVQREIFVQPGAGTVAVDARITPLAPAVSAGSQGGTLTAGPISVSVPAAFVPDGTNFQLTQLSGQGLPGLLPLGWSPLAAFDLRASSAATNLPTAISGLPNVVAHLVTYDPSLHAWTLVTPNLQPASGTASFTVPTTGAYALVVPDTTNPPITIPNVGAALTGIAVQALDPAASSGGSLNPAVLPPGGGTATATLGVQSPTFVPSGTVIQANVSEKFSLASGDVVSEQTRSEDIVLYNALAPANSTMGALFPVTPSHQYSNTQLLTGKVHLDILAGREGVRGQPGGNDPLTLGDGIATISVPGGALSQDTAIAVQTIGLEDFVPTSTTLSALQEVLVDFSGERLNTPAQLSIPAAGLDPTHTFLLTQVQRISGVPHIVAVAVAQINGASLTSVPSPGLPGVISGGEYVFYDISGPSGFVQGTVSSSAGTVQALVQTDSLPITSITGNDGRYIVPALAGVVNLRANALNTLLSGTATVQLTAGQTAAIDILLAGSVNTALVSPADGSLGVPTSTIITVTAPVTINPASINQNNLVVFKGTSSTPGAPVSLQPFVLSVSGTVLTFAPVNNLDPAAQYTVQVGGLADGGGGAIVVPTSTFTTKAAAALNFDPNQITFSFPDQDGNIHVSAPAGSLSAGTKVMIVDQTNAVVLSLTAFNDGSLSGDFPGTINDVLQISVTDPNGATTSFTRSQFVAPDGSVAVGPGGGTVAGPGGVELRIPAGALDQGAVFTIESFGPDAFPERPDVPGGNFGGGIKITSTKTVTFKKEAKLAFPRPAGAPAGAFFQVYGRLQGPNNQVAFEDIDYALPEGQGATAKVVTASFPFRGLIGFNMLMTQADFTGQALDTAFSVPPTAEFGLQAVAFIIWMANDILPGVSLGGAITGRVRYPVPPGGTLPDETINRTGDIVFAGVANARVTVNVDASTHALGSNQTVAITQPDGTFTFSDPNYHGGTIVVSASDGKGGFVTANAIEAVAVTDKTVNDFAGPLLPFYRNVAFADIVVPAPVPPPPTPQLGINFFVEDPNSHLRQPVNGVVASGTPVVIAFKTNGQISNPPTVRINNTSYPTQNDSSTVPGDPNQLDFELSQPFTPGPPGVYTISATSVTPFLKTISASKSFFVVAAGSSNNKINVGTAPIIAGVTPQAGSIGVPVNTFVLVQFSEPVTNLPGNVSLVPDDGSSPPSLKLSGIDYRDGLTVIQNLSPTDAVASMTIQPSDLKYGTHYTLQITSDVVDLDNVADPTKPALHLVQPQDQNPPQVPYDFTTFGPTLIGSTTDAFSSTRPVVFGNRAYVAVLQPNVFSQLNTYDLSDPTNPVLLPDASTTFAGRPMDLAGEQNAEVIKNGTLIAVGSGFATSTFPMPSNLWLYDVTTDQINRVAGISVTSSAVNVGQILRVTLHGNFAYTSTYPLGISVVDMQQGINEYQNAVNADPRSFAGPVTTDGQGFANDAVVNTIPVQDPTKNGNPNVMLLGIQAGDFVVAGSDPQNPTTQTLVVATGAAPGPQTPNQVSFVVADPSQPSSSALLYSGSLQSGNFGLNRGVALALGQINIPDTNGNPVPHPIAVAVGSGVAPDPVNPTQTTSLVLAVVDMTAPATPKVLSLRGLSAFPNDVVMKDNFALVGESTKTEIFDLTDPANPFLAGAIDGIGGTLAVNGFLYSTSFSGTGLHVAALGALAFVKSFDPRVIEVSAADQIFSDVTITYGVIPPDPQIKTAEVHIDVENGGRAVTLPGPVSNGTGSVIWPRGSNVAEATSYVATVHAKSNGAELPTVATRVPLLRVPIIIAPLDRMVRIQVALPDQQMFKDKNGNPIDTYSVNVYLNRNPGGTPDLHISSQDINNAYPNRDTWFTTSDGTGAPIVDGSADATRDWVTRKIDEFLQPLGVTNTVRMQGYEIGTMLSSAASVYVTVVSEKDGTILAKKLAGTVPNQAFADLEAQVDQGVNPTGAASTQNQGVTANAGMDFRLMLAIFESQLALDVGTTKGILKGFYFGLSNDLSLIWNIVTFPVHASQTIADLKAFFGNLTDAFHQMHDLFVSVKKLGANGLWQFLKAGNDFLNATIQTKDSGLIFQVFGAVGYPLGFVVGIIAYIILQVAITKGIVALARAVLDSGQIAKWATYLSVTGAKFVIAITDFIRPIFDVGLTEAQVAQFFLNVAKFMARFVQLFMNGANAVASGVGKVIYTLTAPVAKLLVKILSICTLGLTDHLLSWLGAVAQAGSRFIAQMEEAALERLLTFVSSKLPNESILVQTVENWLQLTNGGLDIANAFRAYDGIVDLADASRTRLVLVEEAAGKDAVDGLVQVMEHTGNGDRVPSVLKIIDDAKFSDQTVRDLTTAINDKAFDMANATDDEIKGIGYILAHDCE